MEEFNYDNKDNGEESIKYLDRKPGAKGDNDRMNKIREKLVIFLFKIPSDHPYLTKPIWKKYYDQLVNIKNYFITNFGNEDTKEVSIIPMGGQNYSYDFGVKFMKEDNTIQKIMALEYKHQAGWEQLPQFYQMPIANTDILCADMPSLPKFLFDTGIVEEQINLLNSIMDLVPQDIKNKYGSEIKPLNYDNWLKCVSKMESPGLSDYDDKTFWKKIDNNTNLFFRIGRHLLKCECEGSYCNPTGTCTLEMMQKAEKWKRISKLGIHNFLCEFKNKVRAADIANLEDKIRTKQGTKEIDTVEIGKGKTYMFIDKNNNWFIEPNPDVWKLDKDPSKIQIWGTAQTKNFVSNIDIPLQSGNKLTCKVRWQNVDGLHNPSLQCNAELIEHYRKFMFDNKFPDHAEDIIPKKDTNKRAKRTGCDIETPSIEAPLTTKVTGKKRQVYKIGGKKTKKIKTKKSKKKTKKSKKKNNK